MKNITNYIREFNIKQHKDLDLIERFPLEIFFPITSKEIQDITEGYYISNYSRVYNINTKKFLKTTSPKDTYPSISYKSTNNKYKSASLHRVLMMVFNPLDDYTGAIVNHLDGKKANSFLYNLEWTDSLGNSRHARDTGLLHPAHGETHCCAKITAKQAEEICKYLESRMYSQKEIARRMNVAVSIVESIKQGKAWKDISEKYNLKFKAERISRIFTYENIHNICKYFQDNPKEESMSLRQYNINCLDYLNLEVIPSNINSLRKIYKKERWKFICNNYNY